MLPNKKAIGDGEEEEDDSLNLSYLCVAKRTEAVLHRVPAAGRGRDRERERQ